MGGGVAVASMKEKSFSWLSFGCAMAAVMEGPTAKSLFDNAVASGIPAKDIIYNMFMSGLTFYLYNEVAFMTLDKVHPITHAVGNTIKRVVIIGASIIVFKNEVTTQGYIGSAIAIFGVLLYSMAQDYYKGK